MEKAAAMCGVDFESVCRRFGDAAQAAHCGNVGYRVSWPYGNYHCQEAQEAQVETLIETDARSRVVLPGHPEERFLVQENQDGSLLLQPARVVTEAQAEYDNNPELRELLARASESSTVRKARKRRVI